MSNWPEDVHFLCSSCNISGPYGKATPGYPNDINSWVQFELRTGPDNTRHHTKPSKYIGGNSNTILVMEYDTVRRRVSHWFDSLVKESNITLTKIMDTVLGPSHKFSVKHWNFIAKTKYNLAWAHLEYTEGQPKYILDLLELSSPLPSSTYPSLSEIRHGKKKIIKTRTIYPGSIG